MRGNKGVCLHAVEQDGYALEFAHESMQGKTLNATPAVVPLVLQPYMYCTAVRAMGGHCMSTVSVHLHGVYMAFDRR